MKYFLGLEIARSDSGIYLHQRKYYLDILRDTGLQAAKPSPVPIEQNHNLLKSTSKPLSFSSIKIYRRLTGRLIYLTITRPELNYAVHILAQFISAPLEDHLHAAFRVVKYLKGTPGHVSRSSSEAEYRALADTCCEIVWILSLLHSLSLAVSTLVPLHCDNKSALYLASNPVFHERTKHIEIDCHLVRQKLQQQVVTTQHITSKEHPADFLTKALFSRQLQYLLAKLGVSNLFAPPTLRGML
ncbi:hypothetical protein AgCh_028251 [Apium graveolens]